ncbi:MAG: hypothetical protein M1832_005185 [Thelocarpon impressellum]|nr:MAG: hypothetical protein M1832_005185 [Thelocarpon impressellum]
MPQPLGSKDASLFRQVIRNYDSKQYKKGLKTADQILRKNPNHGETLAMKALIINSQGRSEEAFAMAKEALRFDMKSHVCWHVYGLLYRAEKNFEEAIKAYKFALKLEPDSPNIQRDLALLQIQMRDYQGYIVSRRTMLQSKSGQRQYWTALAVANHLAGNLSTAESVLTTYEETLKTPPPKSDMEHSEAVLYKNTIIAEMGETERALDHLETISKNNLDRTAVLEMRARYLLKLGRHAEAEKAYRAMIDRNPENRAYFAGLEQAMGAKEGDRKSMKTMYDEYAEKNPRGDAPRRIPLDFLEGEDFREAADKYLQRMLNKGVPSTFANIKALYPDVSKRNMILELVKGYTAGRGVPQANGSAEKPAEDDTSKMHLAALYFLAQHYNYYLSRDLKEAMANIEKAIELSPTSVDYHMTKARTLKHYGHARRASETMEHARTLDERDRYINTKAAKYQLRAGENDAALKTMSKFTRNETAGGPLGDLHEMQCMWYLSEDGESYARQGKYGLALKRFTSIYDIFDVWQEDQFDFHSFSLKKGQIRAYVDMVRWEDRLREHPFYPRAALAAVRIYVLLHDKPHLAHGHLQNGTNGAGDFDAMDLAERKKAMKKAKKEQQKQEKAETAKGETKKTTSAGATTDADAKKANQDPQGTKLVQTEDPLKDAMKFMTPLLEFSPKSIEAQAAGFEIFIRRKKYLLALKCLLAASRLDPEDHTLHEHVVRLKRTLDELPSPLPEKASTVIFSLFPPLLPPPSTTLASFNDAFLARHATSPRHVLSALRVRHLLDASSVAENAKTLLASLEDHVTEFEDARAGLEAARELKVGEDATKKYRALARAKFPEASGFEEEKGGA